MFQANALPVMDAKGNYNNLLIVEASSNEDSKRFRDPAQTGNASRDSLGVPDTEVSISNSDPDVSKPSTENCKLFDFIDSYSLHCILRTMNLMRLVLTYTYHETGHSPERAFHGKSDSTATGTEDEQRLMRGNYHFSEGVQRRSAAPIKRSACPCGDDDKDKSLATPNIWQKFWRWLRSIIARYFRSLRE